MNMQESWLNGDGMTDEQEKWLNGDEMTDEQEKDDFSFTEQFLSFATSTLERIDDPTIVANVAIGAIMVLCKRLMCEEDK